MTLQNVDDDGDKLLQHREGRELRPRAQPEAGEPKVASVGDSKDHVNGGAICTVPIQRV